MEPLGGRDPETKTRIWTGQRIKPDGALPGSYTGAPFPKDFILLNI